MGEHELTRWLARWARRLLPTRQARLIDEVLAAAGSGWKDIQQVAILVRENRSSGHYFGTMSAVRGSSVRPCSGNIWAALIRRSGPSSCYSSITRLSRPAQADGVLRAAARSRAPAAHRLGDRTRILSLECVDHDGQGDNNR